MEIPKNVSMPTMVQQAQREQTMMDLQKVLDASGLPVNEQALACMIVATNAVGKAPYPSHFSRGHIVNLVTRDMNRILKQMLPTRGGAPTKRKQ